MWVQNHVAFTLTHTVSPQHHPKRGTRVPETISILCWASYITTTHFLGARSWSPEALGAPLPLQADGAWWPERTCAEGGCGCTVWMCLESKIHQFQVLLPKQTSSTQVAAVLSSPLTSSPGPSGRLQKPACVWVMKAPRFAMFAQKRRSIFSPFQMQTRKMLHKFSFRLSAGNINKEEK